VTFVLVFFAGLVYEAFYVWWTLAATQGHAVRAALFAACVGAVSFYGFSTSVHDVRALPALLAGYAAGSYLSVRWSRK
jgi:type IV secretory pathway VirB6-like protein